MPSWSACSRWAATCWRTWGMRWRIRGCAMSELWRQLRKDPLAVGGLAVILALFLVSGLAPVLAGSRPILMIKDGHWYWPALFNYPEFPGTTDFKILKA